MLETCCRPGEILSLQWQDVDARDARADDSRGEGQDAVERDGCRSPAGSWPSWKCGGSIPTGKPFPAGRACVFGNRLGKRLTSIRTAWENARGGRGPEGIPASRPASRGGVPVRGGRRADHRRSEVPGTPEPQHDDSLPQHDQSPASSRVAASRAGESAVRESCKFLQRDSGNRSHTQTTPRRRPRRASHCLLSCPEAGAEEGIRTLTLCATPAPQLVRPASSATSAKRGVCRSCYFGPVGPRRRLGWRRRRWGR